MQETWEEYAEAEDLVIANQSTAICDDYFGENANGDVSSALGVKPRRSRKQKVPRRKNPVPLKIPRYEVPEPEVQAPEPEPTFTEAAEEVEYDINTVGRCRNCLRSIAMGWLRECQIRQPKYRRA